MDVAEELTPATDEWLPHWLPHWPLHWHCVDCRRQLLVELGVAKKSLEQQAEDYECITNNGVAPADQRKVKVTVNCEYLPTARR